MKDIPFRMHRTIIWSAITAAGIGVPGAFAAHGDIAAISAIWAAMLVTLASQSGQKLEKDKAVKIVAAVLAGIGGFVGGVKLAETYFAYTGIGTIPAIIANVGINGVLTYIIGTRAARVFLSETLQQSAFAIARAIIIGMGFGFGNGMGDGGEAV